MHGSFVNCWYQSYLNTILIQATLVGIMCGSFFGGIMTDKLGRKRTTEFCLFGIALALVLPVVTIRFLPDNLFMLKYLIVLLCRLAICGFEVCNITIHHALILLCSKPVGFLEAHMESNCSGQADGIFRSVFFKFGTLWDISHPPRLVISVLTGLTIPFW